MSNVELQPIELIYINECIHKKLEEA